MKRTLTSLKFGNATYNFLTLPQANLFKFEVVNKYGSNVERIYNKLYNKNVYGISHFIEHLSFKSPKDYTSEKLLDILKNEGTYNASTDYNRINYWYKTTMENVDLAINLVANIACNTLEDVYEEEFETEKKVVYNEAKRYADDDQTMFWFNSSPTLMGLHPEDNIIGIPETIETFTLEDCQNIKDIFLQNDEVVYNITYDSTIITKNELMEKIKGEFSRFRPLLQTKPIYFEDYMNSLPSPSDETFYTENPSEQAMTVLNFDIIKNSITADSANAYLSSYAEDTSLNDIIREKNGLTYGIQMGSALISYRPYTYFGCDVSKGTEGLMLDLFKQSINQTVNEFNEEKYNKFMKAKQLKRSMSLVDQNQYGFWINLATWYPGIIEELREHLEKDVDETYLIMDEKFNSYDNLLKYMKKFQNCVNNEKFGKVTNI